MRDSPPLREPPVLSRATQPWHPLSCPHSDPATGEIHFRGRDQAARFQSYPRPPFVGLTFLGITWDQYWNQTVGSMGLTDIATGLVKGAIFGVIVAMAGCQRGMKCGNDAAAVGNAATSAVVLGITWIVAADAIIDVIQEVVNV